MSKMVLGNGSTLPVGFRFRPTDEELVDYYLKNMVLGNDSLVQCIAKLDDICYYEPWDLPKFSTIESEDQEWYFMFSPKHKYKKSKRVNRVTSAGYWKVTGNPRNVTARNDTKKVIGMKKTLVFYERSTPDGKEKRTSWVIHEYELTANLPNQNTFVLVKLKKKDEEEKADDSRDESGPNLSTFGKDSEGLSQNGGGVNQDHEVYSNLFSESTREEPASSTSWSFCDGDYDMTQNYYYSSRINEEEDEFCNSLLVDCYEDSHEDEMDHHHD